MMMTSSSLNDIPSTPGKFKSTLYTTHRFRFPKYFTLYTLLFLTFVFFYFFLSPPSTTAPRRGLRDSGWDNQVKGSAKTRSRDNHVVLVTGVCGFVGAHAAVSLKKRGDGVVGIDNFNDYYDVNLKKMRKFHLLDKNGVFVVDGDINDLRLLKKVFGLVRFSHVLHLAAQAGVRYAMVNPDSYVKSNIDGFVNLLEMVKSLNPQPVVVWASSSSVYGLNTKVPFSEKDRTDQPASLYAVYGPWGRPDMAYIFFTKDILKRKTISIFEVPEHATVARDFTYIDDIVKGCHVM